MEFTIGQVKFKLVLSGERNLIQVQIPLNDAKIGITIRHSPKDPSGEVFGIGIDIVQNPNLSFVVE